ncbi:hypothetical protein MKX01_028685 [Papaver californicum]|nr:hypothetical protein MKX01_028685 [Papaver californicum]
MAVQGKKWMTCSIALGKRRARFFSDEFKMQPEMVRQEKCSKNFFIETNLKKDVLKVYTRLGSIVAKQLNLLAETTQNSKAITNQQQHQYHPQCQQHHQHHCYQQQKRHRRPQQHQQHPRQQKRHHQFPQSRNNIKNTHKSLTDISVTQGQTQDFSLGAATAMERPIHLRINVKNSGTNCISLLFIIYQYTNPKAIRLYWLGRYNHS